MVVLKNYRTLINGSSGGSALAWRKDGRFLAFGRHDGTIDIWDVTTGQLMRTLRGHSSDICSISFHPEGTILASADSAYLPGEIRLWDTNTGQILRSLSGHEDIMGEVAFSLKGDILATANGDVKLWDVATGVELHALNGFSSITFSPDGSTIATIGYGGRGEYTDQGAIIIYDVKLGKEQKRLLSKSSTFLNQIAFSPDGTLIAASGSERTHTIQDPRDLVVILDSSTAMEVKHWHTNYAITNIKFHPSMELIATTGNTKLEPTEGIITLWDLATAEKSQISISGSSLSVAFSPEGRFLANVGLDATVRLWELDY